MKIPAAADSVSPLPCYPSARSLLLYCVVTAAVNILSKAYISDISDDLTLVSAALPAAKTRVKYREKLFF